MRLINGKEVQVRASPLPSKQRIDHLCGGSGLFFSLCAFEIAFRAARKALSIYYTRVYEHKFSKFVLATRGKTRYNGGMEANKKAPVIDALLSSLAGKNRYEVVKEGLCMTCDGRATHFRDAVSEDEYRISGMCQCCQDNVFGISEE